jgi:hypothetical protein
MALEKTNVSIVSKIALIVVIGLSIATFWVVYYFTTQVVTITSPTQAQSNYETEIIFCVINIQTIYSYGSSKCKGIKSLNIMEDFPEPIHMKQIGKSPSLFNFWGGLIVARDLFLFLALEPSEKLNSNVGSSVIIGQAVSKVLAISPSNEAKFTTI